MYIYPCRPQFYKIKVGIKGFTEDGHAIVMDKTESQIVQLCSMTCHLGLYCLHHRKKNASVAYAYASHTHSVMLQWVRIKY